MTVVVDDQIFTTQRHGGVSRYFVELLDAFASSPELGVDARTPFRYIANEHLRTHGSGRFRDLPGPAALRRGRVMRLANSLTRRPGSTRRHLVHHTYYLPDGLRLPAAARVCTIYDMTPEVLPDLFPHGSPHAAKQAYVQACDAICCISETTRRDLLAHVGPLDKPVVVTPLGVRPEFFDAPGGPPGERPYALFVGGRFSYKNFDVVLRAFARLRETRADLRLRCVSGAPFDDAERARIADLGLERSVGYEAVTDEALPALYAGAVCLLFPSRYEGFGLPTVEAFAAGCPVVLADMPCSNEVGGDAAQFFAADDDETLAGIVERLAADAAWRERWIAAGRLRARDFTWRRTAELTAQVYREVGGTA